MRTILLQALWRCKQKCIFVKGNEVRVLTEEEIRERKRVEKQKQEEKQAKLNKRKEKKKEQQGRVNIFAYHALDAMKNLLTGFM